MDQIQTFNTIKNVFAALGAKTADNNYAVPLLNKSNASPQGFMDMASLASVLGGAFMSLVGVQKIRADINYLFSPKGIVPNTSSEDDLIETGIYSIMSDNTAATFPNSMLIVFTQSCTDWPTQNNFTLQFSCSAGGSISGRVCWWGTWYAWSRIDLFGCKSLAELKAALANV